LELLLEFKDFVDVFDSEKVKKLPPYRGDVNLAIKFKKDAKLLFKRLYPLSVRENKVVKKYVTDLRN